MLSEIAMRAIIIREPGDETVLVLGEAPRPTLGPADVRIRVRATALNRADLLQRQGMYPPPPGASDILGMECAGDVVETGPEAREFRPGGRVMAPSRRLRQEACVDHGSVIPCRRHELRGRGAFPRSFSPPSNLFMAGLGALGPHESALVHGGGGGVGTAAILLMREEGRQCFVTVGSRDKAARCLELGATAAIDYKTEDFSARVRELTGGRGVDVVLDHIGGRYLSQNLECLAVDGRLVEIGLMGGAKAELNLAQVLVRRLAVIGSTLRGRSVEKKAAMVRAFRDRFGHSLAAGRLRPVIHATLPLADAAEAHRLMQSSAHFGKIVLRVD